MCNYCWIWQRHQFRRYIMNARASPKVKLPKLERRVCSFVSGTSALFQLAGAPQLVATIMKWTLGENVAQAVTLMIVWAQYFYSNLYMSTHIMNILLFSVVWITTFACIVLGMLDKQHYMRAADVCLHLKYICFLKLPSSNRNLHIRSGSMSWGPHL